MVQGMALGAFIQGFQVEDRAYVGGMFDWFSIFSVVTGLALVSGYALLGCTWLIWRTEGSLQEWAYNLSKPLFLVVVGFVAVVSIWTPLLNDTIAQRWFSWPNILYLSPVPILTACCSGGRSTTGGKFSLSRSRWACSCCPSWGWRSACGPT